MVQTPNPNVASISDQKKQIMNLYCCKHNRAPKCHFTQKDIPLTARLQKDWPVTVIAGNSISKTFGDGTFHNQQGC